MGAYDLPLFEIDLEHRRFGCPRVVAKARDKTIAEAAFDAACRAYPECHVRLRKDGLMVRERILPVASDLNRIIREF